MKAAAAFLGILAVALAIALGVSRSEIQKLKAAAAITEKAGREKTETSDEQLAALRSRIRSLENQVQSEPTATDVPAPRTAASAGKSQPKGTSNWAQASRAMMDNPEMREMMRAQQEAGLKVMYGQVLDSLDLTDEERKQVIDELLAAQQAAMGSGMKLMDPSTPEAERKELQKQITDAASRSQEQLKEILGPEKYATFQQYQDSQPERMQLNTMRQRLTDAQVPFTGDQEQKLMDLMYRERVAATGASSPPPGSDGRWPAGGADEMLKQVELAEQRSSRIIENAGGILSQQQLEIFRATQEDTLRMQRLGAEMMKQMSKTQQAE